MKFDSPRSLLVIPVALVVAMAVVFLARPYLGMERLSNLEVGSSEVSALYVMLDPQIPGRGYVTDRQGSTFRRSDDPVARQPWTFVKGGGEDTSGNLAHWLLRSKKRGTFLLVPVFDVPGWGYPFFHEFARQHGGAEGLPQVRWVRLFVNRIYHGLYLQIWLPKADDDGSASALRPELLMVSGDRMGCSDVRFVAPCQVYPELVALGRFPDASAPSEVERWLLHLAPEGERVFFLESKEPYGVAPLSFPVSLQAEYRQVMGAMLPTLLDDRFTSWTDRPTGGDAEEQPFPPALRKVLGEGWEAYRERFAAALQVHCEYHQCAAEIPAALAARLDSGFDPRATAALRGAE